MNHLSKVSSVNVAAAMQAVHPVYNRKICQIIHSVRHSVTLSNLYTESELSL